VCIDIPELGQVIKTMQNRDLGRNFAHALKHLLRKYVIEDVDFHWRKSL
jgi:reverse gyrase